MNLLLVEDNRDMVFFVRKLSKQFHIHFQTCRNTSEFLLATSQSTFDYILCDLNLDYELEGLDIITMHRKNSQSKFIAFTTEDVPQNILESYGFDDVLIKSAHSVENFLKTLQCSKAKAKN